MHIIPAGQTGTAEQERCRHATGQYLILPAVTTIHNAAATHQRKNLATVISAGIHHQGAALQQAIKIIVHAAHFEPLGALHTGK